MKNLCSAIPPTTTRGPSVSHLISLLLWVKDLLQGHGSGSEAVSQFGQYDPVPQRLLQLGGGGKLLPQTRLHPPEEEEQPTN